MWLPWSRGRGGSKPRTFSQAPQVPVRSQDAHCVVLRVTTGDDDAPLVHSCVQDTVQDSVTADATANSGRRRRLRVLPWSWDSSQTQTQEVVVGQRMHASSNLLAHC